MFRDHKYFPVFAAIIFTLSLNLSLTAQELPVEDLNPDNEIMIDTIEQTENLLDSNEVYKNQFDSLSKDGEWVEIDKSEFLQEITEGTGEILDFDESSATTKIIYVWRPYAVDNYWNPYYNGNWVFTNFGWVWSSYYSWGWAPYNYGRWYCSINYGWVWFPGNYWAPNYVTWRSCGNYVGWYPTCPRFRWRGRGTHVYTNHLYAYNPQNWVFVNTQDFSKKIDRSVIVKSEDNSKLLKNSEKVNVLTYKDPSMAKFKYKGPDAISLARESGTRITPRVITAGSNGINIPEVKNNSVVKTGSENPKVKNTNTSKSDTKVNTQSTQTKKTINDKSSDSEYEKKSGEKTVTKTQDKKTETKTVKEKQKTKQKAKQETKQKAKQETKKEKSINNSDNTKSKTGSKNSNSNNSSSRTKTKRLR
ncbi:MAG TPA: hypothetical protein PKA90_02245 [Ignavibacteria bacterium]|nr:hypothetical protein [Ignavibacteria bacterium]HMR39229.1 hypothetical protein [Ignavibacteria bacterium]